MPAAPFGFYLECGAHLRRDRCRRFPSLLIGGPHRSRAPPLPHRQHPRKQLPHAPAPEPRRPLGRRPAQPGRLREWALARQLKRDSLGGTPFMRPSLLGLTLALVVPWA